MLFSIASGMSGMIVLMTGMSFRAFVAVSGLISAIMHVTSCRRLPHMGKQEVTFRNILRDDDKTLSRGV
jgi:hypothetical protein